MDGLIGAALPALRWLHLAALLSGLGAGAFRLLAQRALGDKAGGAGLLRRIDIGVRASLIAALLSSAAWFWLQGSAMFARPIADLAAAQAVAQTSFGGFLLLRVVLLAVALGLLHAGSRAKGLAVLLLAAAALLQGWLGHGAAADPIVALALGIHVLAAGLWLGALPVLLAACVVLPGQAASLARRFSLLGLACVLLLAATSLVQADALVGTLSATLGTGYGLLALAKLLLFVLLLLIAAANRFRFVPAAEAGGSVRGLTISIAAETAIGLATVAVAAALASQPPAIHEVPVWPFALRPVPGFWEDAYLRNGLSRLLAPVAIAALLFLLAAMARRLRWPAMVAGAVALAFVQVPPWRPYVVAAVPTSFQPSPTGYGARSIAAGRDLFQQGCASCHGQDARGRGPVAIAHSVWPPDLSAPLIAGRPGGELFWSIRHGVGAMPATGASDAEIWSLIDFIRLRAGARIFSPSEMDWAGPTRAPGFIALCGTGAVLAPGNGKPLRLWLTQDRLGASAQVQADGAAERCVVEDPAPLAAALSELTGGAAAPSQLLVDANGWLRRAFRTDAEASPERVASELALIRARPLDASSVHH